jgi:hypothetical protein
MQNWRQIEGGLQSISQRYKASSTELIDDEIETVQNDDETVQSASVERPIPSENVGFQLLQKMGWTPNTGLGRARQGIVDPIVAKSNAPFVGATWGLGLESHEQQISSEATSKRKTLEAEIQLNETEEQLQERIESAEKKRKLQEAVKEELKEFYCDLCKKQYNKAVDYERHLGSYDHNHKVVSVAGFELSF